ncbi:MAG: response regulator transcription factor [Clostridiales bacterium]|nr:response regulator transcription factor [Clostridiales bacterium]
MEEKRKIPVLIADDDAGMRLILRKKIEKTEGFVIAAEAEDGKAAMTLFDAVRPQVVFLDVDMPALSGVECARLMQDADPGCILIFATGHEEYMSEAFEVYAFDYLVKPFKLERLGNTLERIKERIAQRAQASQTPVQKKSIQAPQSRMMLRHRDGVSFVDVKDIILIQREDRATVMYTEDNGRYVLPDTLGEMESKLDEKLFFRCHKSYIVNLERIRDITPYGRWTYIIRLEGTQHDALITHEKYEELEQRFNA